MIKWNSKKIPRVVKSSLAAETLALLEAADNAYFLKRLLESILSIPESLSVLRYAVLWITNLLLIMSLKLQQL